MIRQSTYTPLLALLGVAATLAVAYAQRPARAPERPRFVLTEREAFLLAPAELVAAPTVRGAVWSSNGRYVLAIRHDLGPIPPPGLISSPEGQPPPGEVSLVLWNRAARRSREVWKKRAEVSDVKSIAWLPGTNVALAEVAWIEAAPPGAPRQEGMPPGRIGRRTVLRLDAAGGVVSALPITEPTEQLFHPREWRHRPADPGAEVVLRRRVVARRPADLRRLGAGARGGESRPDRPQGPRIAYSPDDPAVVRAGPRFRRRSPAAGVSGTV
jgi:hypothetical protein